MVVAFENNSIHDIENVYNNAISEIPYENFKDSNEYLYVNIFMSVLYGACIIAMQKFIISLVAVM